MTTKDGSEVKENTPEVEKVWKEFWEDICTNEDGSLNLQAIKNELSDFSMMLDIVPEVYYSVTGGIISKPLTTAANVIRFAEELREKETEQTILWGLEDIENEGVIDEKSLEYLKNNWEKHFR